MAIYFNIIIPVKTFLDVAKEVMFKYNVKLYIEKASVNGNKKRRYYVGDNISESDFRDNDYHQFFFSTKDVNISDKEIILESGKVIYSNWFSFYDEPQFSIEGIGGHEDDNNIECIKLRSIAKEPDKQVKLFYNSLQTKLKNIEDIKCYKLNSLNHHIYYLDTHKKMWSNFEKQVPVIMK